MAAQKTPTLVELAEKLLEQAREIEKAIPAPPTFQEDTLANLPLELEKTRLSLIDTSEMFTSLVRGSDGAYGRIMRIASYQYLDEVALHAIHHFRIPQRVPLDGSISYAELAAQCHIDEDRLTSLLRMAITFHMFYEPTPGQIAHTADSRLLVEDSAVFDFIGAVRMEHKPGTLKVNEALEKWPGSPEPFHSPYNLAHNTDKPMYLHLQQYPERLRQFAGAMTSITRAGARSIALIAKAYPWADLAPGSTVVDVGGGNGHISIGLATEFPGLRFVVQDLPHASDEGIAGLPAALQDRVSFMTHDFFTPQPVQGAEAYFIANVIHNWSDQYAVRILRALIPALKPGARVLVCDRLIPEPGTVPLVEEREIRALDLIMHILLNAKEHTEAEMRALFKAADERFEYVDTHAIPHGLFKVCEVVWKP